MVWPSANTAYELWVIPMGKICGHADSLTVEFEISAQSLDDVTVGQF